MQYLTPKLKDKLHSSLGLSYVIEGEEGHNDKEAGNVKLIVADITPQNDLITINFDASAGEPTELTVNSETLREFAAELISWADIMDETLPTQEEIDNLK